MAETSAAAAENDDIRKLVAQVAASYFANSHVNSSEIPSVIAQIATSLSGVGAARERSKESEAEAAGPKLTRADIRKSIRPDGLISFEDGKAYKTLRRHLSTHGLTPEQYRDKWGLPADYPMVAPSYSAARSELAKKLGLGQKGQAARKSTSAGKRGRRSAQGG